MKRSLWLMIICGLFFITGCTFNSTYINEEGERIKAEKVTDSLYNYTKYNAFGQVVMTGLYNDTEGSADGGASPDDARRTVLQTLVNAPQNILWESRLAAAPAAAETGYTNSAFPTTVAMYLSINYYDDYAFPGGNPYPNTYTQMLKGLLTGSRIKVLKEATAAGTTDMLWNINYYDNKGRVVHSYSQHYKGGSIAAANCTSPLKAWTKFRKQFRTIKLGNHEKRKKGVHP